MKEYRTVEVTDEIFEIALDSYLQAYRKTHGAYALSVKAALIAVFNHINGGEMVETLQQRIDKTPADISQGMINAGTEVLADYGMDSCTYKIAREVYEAMEPLDGRIDGYKAELDLLVEQILIAKDLGKLQEVTRKNFPDHSRAAKVNYIERMVKRKTRLIDNALWEKWAEVSGPEEKQSAENAQSSFSEESKSSDHIPDSTKKVDHECAGRTDGHGGFTCVTCGKYTNPSKSTGLESDGWIMWNGGKQPVDDDVLVEVKWQNEGYPASSYSWDRQDDDWNIVAYRIIKEPEAKEEPKKQTLLEFIKNHPARNNKMLVMSELDYISEYLQQRGI